MVVRDIMAVWTTSSMYSMAVTVQCNCPMWSHVISRDLVWQQIERSAHVTVSHHSIYWWDYICLFCSCSLSELEMTRDDLLIQLYQSNETFVDKNTVEFSICCCYLLWTSCVWFVFVVFTPLLWGINWIVCKEIVISVLYVHCVECLCAFQWGSSW